MCTKEFMCRHKANLILRMDVGMEIARKDFW